MKIKAAIEQCPRGVSPKSAPFVGIELADEHGKRFDVLAVRLVAEGDAIELELTRRGRAGVTTHSMKLQKVTIST